MVVKAGKCKIQWVPSSGKSPMLLLLEKWERYGREEQMYEKVYNNPLLVELIQSQEPTHGGPAW